MENCLFLGVPILKHITVSLFSFIQLLIVTAHCSSSCIACDSFVVDDGQKRLFAIWSSANPYTEMAGGIASNSAPAYVRYSQGPKKCLVEHYTVADAKMTGFY